MPRATVAGGASHVIEGELHVDGQPAREPEPAVKVPAKKAAPAAKKNT